MKRVTLFKHNPWHNELRLQAEEEKRETACFRHVVDALCERRAVSGPEDLSACWPVTVTHFHKLF